MNGCSRCLCVRQPRVSYAVSMCNRSCQTRSQSVPIVFRASTFASRRGRTRLCRTRSVLRSENIRKKPYRWWESSACLCRWRAAHPQQLLCRPRMYRRGILPRPKSPSVRKKSPTSAWGRSTSSTRKTPERPDSAKNLPEAADAAAAAGAGGAAEAAAEAAAAAAEAVAEAAAAEAAAAVCRGEFAVSARLGALRLR
jgi:hypothetical protein